MRRTTPLTAAALLGLALLAPTTSATAAGETCRGEAATIVGTTAKVTGTEGRDVIVTGRATDVTALGGDDLVCVVPDGTNYNVLKVDAGPGADVVDTTAAPSGYYVDTDLGAGADTLEGGPGGDWVETGDASGNTTEVDVVRSGSGDDIVTTSGGSDVVELGPGNNTLVLDGTDTTPQGRLEGGDGYDTLVTSVAPPAEHAFDLAAGTYRTAGASADFSSIESLNVQARGAAVAITGTEGDDRVIVRTDGPEPSIVAADLLGGDDDLLLDGADLGRGGRIELGSGEDHLVAARTTGKLALDLKRAVLQVKDIALPAVGVEDAFLMARKVSLVGDEQDNTLSSLACTTTITGGHGDDELVFQGDDIFEDYSFSCPKSAEMRGGPGDDSFFGTPGKDRLFGDGDRDRIRGGAGDDRIRGGKGADLVQAGTGADDVRGGPGADRLFGDDGRDVLIGEGGRDLVKGSAGCDRCVAERERGCER